MTKRSHEGNDSASLVKTLLVRVFWRERNESKEHCAARLEQCLLRLGSISPLFATWKRLGRSRSEANTEIENSAGALTRRLRQSYTDVPRKPIPELGFSFGAWAGDFNGASANLSIHCGSYGPTSSNYAILNVTCEGAWRDVGSSTIKSLLEALVDAWNPEQGTAGFGLFRELPADTDLDWILYTGAHHSLPPLTDHAAVEALPNGRGSLITITPEPPDLSRGEDARAVESVRRILSQHSP
jgi:hypothetical protein